MMSFKLRLLIASNVFFNASSSSFQVLPATMHFESPIKCSMEKIGSNLSAISITLFVIFICFITGRGEECNQELGIWNFGFEFFDHRSPLLKFSNRGAVDPDHRRLIII